MAVPVGFISSSVRVKFTLFGRQNVKPPWFFATIGFVRTEITQARMLALPIVEGLDVLGHGPPGPGSMLSVKNLLTLQRLEEALRTHVVPTISFSAHALSELIV
jgi:hypothetical protein